MLVSIAFGIFILAIIYVIYWGVKNDAAQSIEDQVGFIRMRVPKTPRKPATRRFADAALRRRESPPRDRDVR